MVDEISFWFRVQAENVIVLKKLSKLLLINSFNINVIIQTINR